MDKKKLLVRIDAVDDETFAMICAEFRRTSFMYSYWHSFIPPNKMEFEFGPLSETGIENMKEKWRSFGLSEGTFYEEDWEQKSVLETEKSS